MLSIGFGTLVILCAFASSVSSQYGKPERPRPLAVLAPAFNISGLGPDDWAPLADRLGVSHEQGGFVVKPLFFYNQSTYPNELLVHVHIPKTGRHTLAVMIKYNSIFESCCSQSVYRWHYFVQVVQFSKLWIFHVQAALSILSNSSANRERPEEILP